MTDAPPNPPAAAKSGGKGLVKSLKGHPPWLYAVIVVGAIAVAYMVRKHQNEAAAAAMASSPDDTSTPYGGYEYDTSAYPGSTQGAYYGGASPGDESPVNAPASPSLGDWADFWSTIIPVLGGGGMPSLPDGAHTVPTVDVPAPVAGVINADPAPSQTVQQPPAPAPHLNPVSGPQPTTGPGIFYNSDRKLRYIVQNKKTATYPRGHNFRGYESKLNKGDWGQGGWIPQ